MQTGPSRVVSLVESTDTGEIVRSIPAEEVQHLAAALDAGRQVPVDLKACNLLKNNIHSVSNV